MVDLNLQQTAEQHESGEAVREECLSLDAPILEALEKHLHYIRTVNNVEPTPAAIAHLRNDLTLQYHHGGNPVLCRRTEKGVIVIAVGLDEVKTVYETTPSELRSDYVLEFPIPW